MPYMKKVLVPLAPGFEEIEAVTVIDILRRAGVDVTVAGVTPGDVKGRTQIRIRPDVSMDEVVGRTYDMVVLPGGAGAVDYLKKDVRLHEILRMMDGQGKKTAAICAAPTVLTALALLDGKRLTSHPSVRAELSEQAMDVQYSEDRVVVDGNLITSRSPGTAMEFAFRLVEILEGRPKAEEINRGVLALLSG